MQIKKYTEFNGLNEKHHVYQDVRHLTNLIYNRINYYLSKSILNKEVQISNFLEKNYTRIKFKNDIIIIKLGKQHGAINDPIYINNCLENLKIHLTINLSKDELSNKYLINNKIKETINHECQHIIEFYNTGGNLPISWDFNKRLKLHEDKFKNYDKWVDIIHMFYLTEDHEIRSSISQLLEEIKNNENKNDIGKIIINSDIYKKYKNISNIDSSTIINIMKNKYDNFDDILMDFIRNVIINQSNDIDLVFRKEMLKIKSKSKKCLKKLLRVGNNFTNENLCDGSSFTNDCNFEEYIAR